MSYCVLLLLLQPHGKPHGAGPPCPADHFLPAPPLSHHHLQREAPQPPVSAFHRVPLPAQAGIEVGTRGPEAAHLAPFSGSGCALRMPARASVCPRRRLLRPRACVWHVWARTFLPHVKPAPVGGEPRLPRLNQESKSHHPRTPSSTAIWLPPHPSLPEPARARVIMTPTRQVRHLSRVLCASGEHLIWMTATPPPPYSISPLSTPLTQHAPDCFSLPFQIHSSYTLPLNTLAELLL